MAQGIPAALAEVVRHDPATIDEAVALAETMRSTGLRIQALVALLPHHPSSEQQTLLDLITGSYPNRPGLTDDGRVVSTALVLPWARLPVDALVQQLFGVIEDEPDNETQAAAYAALAASAPVGLRADIISRGLTASATVRSVGTALRAWPWLPAPLPASPGMMPR